MAVPFPDALPDTLATLPPANRYLIAFSGGVDSMALLHALAFQRERLGVELLAIHVDHGLQPQSSDWAAWCRARCEELAIPFRLHALSVTVPRGESPEAAARQARYQAFTGEMRAGDILLTAHHQDDQAETVLLNLLRGAGPAGLAAMPHCRPFGPGYLARPLLGVARKRLLAYARGQGLAWLDDPSNQDTAFDRNYLRQVVFPFLEARWPACAETLARSAGHCAEAERLLDRQAQGWLAQAQVAPNILRLAPLAGLDLPQRRLALRYWLRRQGAPLPDQRRLEQLATEPFTAGEERHPRLAWSDAVACRFRGELHLLRRTEPFRPPDGPIPWSGGDRLDLPGNGWLEAVSAPGGIAPEKWSQARIEVRYRQGGEQCRLPRREGSRPLKKRLQEAGVPPWLRERLPLITLDGQLAAVPGFGVCEPFASEPGRTGMGWVWHRPELTYAPNAGRVGE